MCVCIYKIYIYIYYNVQGLFYLFIFFDTRMLLTLIFSSSAEYVDKFLKLPILAASF